MDEKSKSRLIKRTNRNLTLALLIFLLAVIVYATAPITPTTISPNNEAIIIGSNVTLTCSGSTDAESNPISYIFYGNYSGLGLNGTTTNVSELWGNIKSHPGDPPAISGGSSFADPYLIGTNGDGGGNNYEQASKFFRFNDNFWTVQLQGIDTGAGVGGEVFI